MSVSADWEAGGSKSVSADWEAGGSMFMSADWEVGDSVPVVLAWEANWLVCLPTATVKHNTPCIMCKVDHIHATQLLASFTSAVLYLVCD